jgi:hypothetical protein
VAKRRVAKIMRKRKRLWMRMSQLPQAGHRSQRSQAITRTHSRPSW